MGEDHRIEQAKAPREGRRGNLGIRGAFSYLFGMGGYDLAHGQKTGTTIARGDGLKSVRAACAGVRPGDPVPVVVRRAGETRELTLTAGEGL